MIFVVAMGTGGFAYRAEKFMIDDERFAFFIE
jgi:hypothetical protein